MISLVDVAVARTRTVMVAFFLIVIAGIVSYQNMPKEAEPDIAFPFVQDHVLHPSPLELDGLHQTAHPGPDDAHRIRGRHDADPDRVLAPAAAASWWAVSRA